MRYAKNAIRNRTGLRVANARRKGQGSSEELGAGVYFGVHSPVTLSGPANRTWHTQASITTNAGTTILLLHPEFPRKRWQVQGQGPSR
jgi:hypothetical protein